MGFRTILFLMAVLALTSCSGDDEKTILEQPSQTLDSEGLKPDSDHLPKPPQNSI